MMESLGEVWGAAFLVVNLPFTLLLMVVLAYWVLVMIGVLDSAIGDGHLHLEVGGEGHMEAGVEGAGAHGGVLGPVLQFLHFGEIPATAVMSVLALCLWMFSMLGNHYFNPENGLLIAGLLLVPNGVVSLILAHFLVLPMKPLFRVLSQDYDAAEPILGQLCEICTTQADVHYGQANVKTGGAPITIQVRTNGDEVVARGEQAVVVSHDAEHSFYRIKKFDEPKLET